MPYIIILKVRKFHQSTRNRFGTAGKKPVGGHIVPPPPSLNRVKVAVGPNLSTNRNLKQVTKSECTKTTTFQLLWTLDISELVDRELNTIINHTMDLF